MAWNGFCARCGRLVSRLTIDTVNIDGERRTALLCERCWITIRHPERVKKPKEPTVIAKDNSVKIENHTIQWPEDDPYKKVVGEIKTEEEVEEEVKE